MGIWVFKNKKACYICYFTFFLKKREINFKVATYGRPLVSRGATSGIC